MLFWIGRNSDGVTIKGHFAQKLRIFDQNTGATVLQFCQIITAGLFYGPV